MFPLGEQPKVTRDLVEINNDVQELSVDGKTKNIELLGGLKIRELWVFAVNQKQFDKIMTYVNPEVLYVYEMRVEDLSKLQEMNNLRALYLCWNTKNTNLWDLKYNKNLSYLLIEDFSKLEDLTPIKDGQNLEGLYLGGGIVKALNIKTLEPIGDLVQLNTLILMNIKVKDLSLEPLMNLEGLKKLNLSNQFPMEEYAKLSVVLQNTECEFFKPYVRMESTEGKDIMMIGRKRPFLNSKTDTEKIKKYEQEFKNIQDEFRNKIK
ncbi:leucine-rich repeat domain-containing protein [Bacillus sp. FDAARGOS_235]|uniref:leucine-rich repeat domain-containing protein n=1 Tax=Bacillus sp. FDAARGOS_235 TaxID=1839798 RepID=UPI0011A1E89C|nr:leucine-rich repeat domain-containing protein [Bacillus sp. FDAARGOS_235]